MATRDNQEFRSFRPRIAAVFFVLAATAVTPAHAVFVSDALKPPSTDLSVWMLREVFGGLVDEIMGSGGGVDTVATKVIAWMLSTIIVPLGGLILLYSSYLGISHSSMHGELFGDKKQAYWVAVRTVVAFGLVTPAPALKGLALINLLIMTISLHGVGGATSLWVSSSDALMKTPTFGVIPDQSPALFDGLLRGELCAAAYNQFVAAQGDPPGPVVALKKIADSDDTAAWAWARGNSNGGFCGEFSAEKAVPEPPTIASPLQVSTVSAEATKRARDAMAGAQAAGINGLQASASRIAKAMIAADAAQGAPEPSTADYANSMAAFSQAMQGAAVSAASSVLSETANAWKNAAKQDGWATAGFYFVAFGALQSDINRTSGMDWAHVTPVSAEDYMSRFGDETVHGRAIAAWRKMDNFIINGHKSIDKSLAIERQGNSSANGEPLPFYEGKDRFTRIILNRFKDMVNNNAHPLEMLRDLGTWALNFGLIAYGADVAVDTFLSSGISGIVVSGGAKALGMKIGTGALHAIALTLLALGVIFITASLMPSLIWLTNLLRWLFSVTVAQFATPLWAVLHAHPEGEGIAGAQARAGYMLVLSLALRPILLTASLLIAYYAMSVMGMVLNKVLFATITGFDFGWMTPFFFILIYGAALYSIIKISLDEMGSLTSGFLDWIGGGRSDPSDAASSQSHLMAGFLAMRNKLGGPARVTRQGMDRDSERSGVNISGNTAPDRPHEVPTDKLLGKDD